MVGQLGTYHFHLRLHPCKRLQIIATIPVLLEGQTGDPGTTPVDHWHTRHGNIVCIQPVKGLRLLATKLSAGIVPYSMDQLSSLRCQKLVSSLLLDYYDTSRRLKWKT